MFRDESTKVMQKAHAQWGVGESSEMGESSGSSPTPTSPSSSRSRSQIPEATTPRSHSLAARGYRTPDRRRLTKEIGVTPVDRAVKFYIDHYVIGLPDEPRAG